MIYTKNEIAMLFLTKYLKWLEVWSLRLGTWLVFACIYLRVESRLEGNNLKLTWDLERNDLVPPLLHTLTKTENKW